MRIALAAALIMAAAIAWADEPSTPEAEPEAAAEAAPEQTVEPAAATEPSPAAASTTEDDKPFKVPAGYRAKKVEGKQMYCTKVVVLGSRFGKESCRTEAQLRELERQREATAIRENPACAGSTCSSK